MACKPQYKGKRYNSLEELYKANGVNPQQKQQAQQQYSQYLDTIFPDSKVKDIVWRNDESEKNVLDTKSPNKAGQYRGKFFGTYEEVQYHGGQTRTMFPILLNITKPYNTDSSKKLDYFYTEDVNKIKQSHDGVVSVKYDTKQPYEYVVFEPEQIHILGSKQDIEGFKEFIKKQEEIQKESPISQRIDKTFISTEELIFSLNNKEFFKDFIKNNNIKTEITKDEALINNKGESLNAYYNTDKNQIVLSKNATEKDLYTAILEYYLLENTDEEINNLLYDLYTEIIDSENYNISSEVDFVNKLFTSSRIKEDLKTVDSKSEEYKSLFDEFLSVISNKNSISAQEIEELLIKPSIVISQDTMSIEKMPDITSMRVLRKIESC